MTACRLEMVTASRANVTAVMLTFAEIAALEVPSATGLGERWNYVLKRLRCSGVFFFFQAEDGIRDLIVTGVQTCALPIYVMKTVKTASATIPRIAGMESFPRDREDDKGGTVVADEALIGHLKNYAYSFRSEERRVGKECRSRWSPYH